MNEVRFLVFQPRLALLTVVGVSLLPLTASIGVLT